jgi:hypothetical protein
LWEDASGETREGVYIPRRDTNSFISSAVGGRLFPGEHHRANFAVAENGNKINFSMKSADEIASVKLSGTISENLPENSVFASLAEASDFFEKGSLGYSVTKDGTNLDGINLEIEKWKVEALNVDFVESSFYDDETMFPKDSIEFDHALLMQNVEHRWHGAPSFDLTRI